ncbi:hypothetical protein [Lacihabitans sp. CS3-21]|uniref:hypothetical protein n=1 Tax=Lacihabitans sp. CS3-21 TaxID=2487332 RepID=UPI0020CB8646|nr:hypothetical protein [Lacihabitans sp. CS3-21]MCP9749328.1 hypothetical protein [Lacihabitans sp. CS3-21]
MKFDLNKLTNLQLIVILLVIIVIIPPLLKNVVTGSWFDYTDSGEIGDTLGGITAPFINGLAALLVFITFKEQVKANKLIQQQQYFQHIHEQINRLEDDFLNISDITRKLDNEILTTIFDASRRIGSSEPFDLALNESSLNKIMYSTTVFNQALLMIARVDNNQDFLQGRLKLLFKIIYKENYSELVRVFNKALIQNCDQKEYIGQIVTEMKKLNNKFAE